jgi:hypothetical protein
MHHVMRCKLEIMSSGFCACTYRQTLRRRTSPHHQFEHTGPAVRTFGVEYQSSQQHLQRNGKVENKKTRSCNKHIILLISLRPAQRGWIHRDIPWQLRCSGQRYKKRILLKRWLLWSILACEELYSVVVTLLVYMKFINFHNLMHIWCTRIYS